MTAPQLDCALVQFIPERFACRADNRRPIAAGHARRLATFAEAVKSGPLGTPLRFEPVVAQEQDPNALRGLGTYGLIKNPAGFVVGWPQRSRPNSRDSISLRMALAAYLLGRRI